MSSTSSSLVIGFSAGLPPALIEPFIHSLRKTPYAGRIGLVLAHYEPSDRRALEALADVVWVVDDLYLSTGSRALRPALAAIHRTRGLRRTYAPAFRACVALGRERNALQRWQAFEFHLEGLQALRYTHYYDAIRDTPDADQIFLSDLRDVLFQGDPFAPPLAGLELFAEDHSVRIGDEPFNRRWIQALYGSDTLNSMAAEPVSCSGTVTGPRAEIMHYLKEMQTNICWRRRPLGSHDQGVHNHLLRTGRLSPAKLFLNGEGRVLTMGAMRNVARDTDGFVVNDDGSRPSVLHQYDRHPALARELLRTLI